jgi:hypothetical protein
VTERVALARDQNVVATVESHFDWTAELVRRQRRPNRQVPGLGFFAAKAPAHAAAHHAHLRQGNVQRMRHPVLHLAGMLRATVD